MARPKRAVTAEPAVQQPVRENANSQAKEYPILHCMGCDRLVDIWAGEKIYTVKYRSGRIAVVCPSCALHKTIRMKTEGVTYDAKRFLNIGKGDA
ncbi:MAG: hypothetical protein IKG87_06415 [Clostridia bacterium]|nr:hypothetical protein [Clostridia bacterium]